VIAGIMERFPQERLVRGSADGGFPEPLVLRSRGSCAGPQGSARSSPILFALGCIRLLIRRHVVLAVLNLVAG